MKANPKNETFFLKLVEDGLLVIQPDGSIFNGKTLKVYDRRGPKGHIHISYKHNRKTKHILAHRLVYLAKIGPLSPDDQVIHLDGVKWNNIPSNLTKGDGSDVMLHAYAIGQVDKQKLSEGLLRRYSDQLQINARLTPEQAIEIRTKFAAGATKKGLARAYQIDRSTIIGIIRGTLYKPAKRGGALNGVGERPTGEQERK